MKVLMKDCFLDKTMFILILLGNEFFMTKGHRPFNFYQKILNYMACLAIFIDVACKARQFILILLHLSNDTIASHNLR